jgi:hypothetical protein
MFERRSDGCTLIRVKKMKTGALMGERAYADRDAARQMPQSMPPP